MNDWKTVDLTSLTVHNVITKCVIAVPNLKSTSRNWCVNQKILKQ